MNASKMISVTPKRLARQRTWVLTFICICVICITLRASAWANETIRHRVRIEGQGLLTVILEGGLGDTLEVWNYMEIGRASCRERV